MTPPETHDERLEELRRRWEEEPGSRIFLQLAEEYRHRERHGEALEVLRRGLEAHPNQVSALVALGRVHLEMGEPRPAGQALEKALDIDATNAVAMKLAVESYLRQGDRDQARQRLELYKLLNASDPEIEELESRVAGRVPAVPAPPQPPSGDGDEKDGDEVDGEEAEPSTAGHGEAEGGAGPQESGDAAAKEPTAPSASLHSGGEVWSPTAAWPGLPREAARTRGADAPDGPATTQAAHADAEEPPGSQATAPESPAGSSAGPEVDSDGSSGTLARPGSSGAAPGAGPEPFADLLSGERRRYLEGLGAEGLFPVDLEPEPEPEAEPEPEPEPEPGPGLLAGPEETPEAALGETVEAAVPGAASGAEAAPEPDDEAEAASPAKAATEADDHQAPAIPIGRAGDRPTVTLGQLYLDQGHPGEALRIFEAVLDRDPENIQARTGLLRSRAAVAAAERQADAGPATAPTRFPALTLRKPDRTPPETPPEPAAATPSEAASEAPAVAPAEETDAAVKEAISPAAPPDPPRAAAEPPLDVEVERWSPPSVVADRLQDGAPPAEPATGGLTAREDEVSAEAAPPSLTAADLLRDADPSSPPRQALLDAYLARLRGNRSS